MASLWRSSARSRPSTRRSAVRFPGPQLFINLHRGIVEAEFDDRKIRSRRLEKVAETQVGELEFRLIQIGERLAEVDQHQVALVSDQGERADCRRSSAPSRREPRRLPARSPIFSARKRAPGGPAKAHHLMQNAVAFDGERDGGISAATCGRGWCVVVMKAFL